MKIAFLGSRGIPARYSGFETFYEQLATRLAERGHAVTVYNRSHFIRDVKGSYNGVNLVSLPAVRTKHLETISHTFLSSVHSVFQRYDIVYYCIVGNSPLTWIPKLSGAKTLINVDGEDWAREKWSGFAKWYQKASERIATVTGNVIIADAVGIQERYRRLYDTDAVFVPYGANVQRHEGVEALEKWGLRPGEYVLYVGRLVPENAIDLLIEAHKRAATNKKLVIVGDAPYSDSYKKHLRALADESVVFTGYAFGADYAQLSSHAYLYVHPSSVDGTRPALLDQMGFGNCILVRNSQVNTEVIGDFGLYFEGDRALESLSDQIAKLISDSATVRKMKEKVHRRITDYYNWDWVTDFYEDTFRKMLEGLSLQSYDEFIRDKGEVG